MVRKFLFVVAALTLVSGALAARARAATHSGTIENVSLASSGGYVNEEASFKEVGAGSSQVAVWIDVYDGSSGPLKDTLGRKTGTSACQAGNTCFTLLRTRIQTRPGECYVGWASTSSGPPTEVRAPANGRLCP
jgi:hypothetical protein